MGAFRLAAYSSRLIAELVGRFSDFCECSELELSGAFVGDPRDKVEPVAVEVDATQLEDGFGTGRSPAHSGAV